MGAAEVTPDTLLRVTRAKVELKVNIKYLTDAFFEVHRREGWIHTGAKEDSGEIAVIPNFAFC